MQPSLSYNASCSSLNLKRYRFQGYWNDRESASQFESRPIIFFELRIKGMLRSIPAAAQQAGPKSGNAEGVRQCFSGACQDCAVRPLSQFDGMLGRVSAVACLPPASIGRAVPVTLQRILRGRASRFNLSRDGEFGRVAGWGDDMDSKISGDSGISGTGDGEASAGRPTLKTIAFMTGLGVTTVSRALKDAPEIGEETRRRVQLVARQVGYRPNRAGVRLRTGKTNVISLILDTEEQIMGFVSDIIYGISEASRPDALPSDRDALFAQQRSDGAGPLRRRDRFGRRHHHLAHPARRSRASAICCDRGFPFATHGRTEMGIDHPFHDFDNHAFALIAVRRLVALGQAAAGAARAAADAHLPPSYGDGFERRADRERAGGDPLQRRQPSTNSHRPDPRADRRAHAPAEPAGRHRQQRRRRDAWRSSQASRMPVSCSAATSTSSRNNRRRCCSCSGRQIHVVNEDFRLAGRELANSVLAMDRRRRSRARCRASACRTG